jgi:butyrate kinase
MKTSYRVFTINPGSTSTKVALFENETKLYSFNVKHDAEKLSKFRSISEQLPFRKEVILHELKKNTVELKNIDAFSSRGGGFVSMPAGTYAINEALLYHAKTGYTIKHPANLGPQLAKEFADAYGGEAFVVNPPDVDEFNEISRITGIKGVYRESRLHVLNQKEVGIRYGKSVHKPYKELNLIICHIGGGISITMHEKGKMVDSTDNAQGDGPLAPTRCGAITVSKIVAMCYSDNYTQEYMNNLTVKSGGWIDLLGTSDAREVRARIDAGETYAKLVYDAMIYQICKAIGSFAAVLRGKIDAIILTGGIANDQYLTDGIKSYIDFFAPVIVMAGEFEMEALASGAIRVLSGEEKALMYTGIPIWQEK